MTGGVRIFIARHGETEWNLTRRFQGHSDSPLTARGRQQAQCLADRLSTEPLAAIYSSDLGRALETARLVAARHSLDVRDSTALREIDCGQWTGQAKEDLARSWPEALGLYQREPWNHRMPSGEAVADVQWRALEFVRGLWPAHAGQSVAVITHHIVVETLLAKSMKLELDSLWLRIPTGNCFLSVLEYADDVLSPVLVYDGAHLGAATQTYFEGERVA